MKKQRDRNKAMQRHRNAETERRRCGETEKERWRRDTETRRDMETKRPRDGETQRRRDGAKQQLQRGRSLNERGLSKNEALDQIFRKVQTTPLINDEKIWTFQKIYFRRWYFGNRQWEQTRKIKTIVICPNMKLSITFSEDFKKNRAYATQKSIFQCRNGFNQEFESNQKVYRMLLWRFIQVVLNHHQNQKSLPHFSGTGVNGKIYVVRSSKFQRECFAPWKNERTEK